MRHAALPPHVRRALRDARAAHAPLGELLALARSLGVDVSHERLVRLVSYVLTPDRHLTRWDIGTIERLFDARVPLREVAVRVGASVEQTRAVRDGTWTYTCSRNRTIGDRVARERRIAQRLLDLQRGPL